jgi:hypothetical protein
MVKSLRSLTKILLALAALWPLKSQAQVAMEPFGKNRVQYHNDFDAWSYFEGEDITVYWYGRSKSYAEKVIQISKKEIPDIINLLEYKINGNFQVLVYADYADMKQSNLGLDQAFVHRSSLTKVEGDRIFVHYTGNQEDLQIQLREGITAVLLKAMFESDNIREVVRDAVSSDLPPWFRDGLVNFSGDIWNEEKDLQLRNYFMHSKKVDFEKLAALEPALVGNAMWYYIRNRYGRNEIANYLYISRINNSIEKSALYVFGITYEELKSQWLDYFTKRYSEEWMELTQLQKPLETRIVPLKNCSNAALTKLIFKNDGQQFAYALDDHGKVKVYTQGVQSKKRKKWLKYGTRNKLQNPDKDYPLLYWKDNESILGIIYEKRDVLHLQEIDLATGKKQKLVFPGRYQRIFSANPLDNRFLLLSAQENDTQEIFLFDLSTRQSRKLSQDKFDNRQAIPGKKEGQDGFFYLSNQGISSDSTERAQPPYEQAFNLFFESFSTPVVKDTLTAKIDDLRNLKYNQKDLFAVSTHTGIPNVFAFSTQEKFQWAQRAVTAEQYGVYNYAINAREEVLYTTRLPSKRGWKWTLKYQQGFQNYNLPSTEFTKHKHTLRKKVTQQTDLNKKRNERIKSLLDEQPLTLDFTPVDPEIYLFQSEFGNSPEDYTLVVKGSNAGSQNIDSLALENAKRQIINPQKITPYKVAFHLRNTSMDFDNRPLFGGLNTFAGTAMEQLFVPMGFLMKAELVDLLEDYRIEGGVRVPLSFNGTETYLLFENRKKRWDKQFAFYRRGMGELLPGAFLNQFFRRKTVTTLGQATLSYPLDMFQSFRIQGTFRQDNTFFQSTNRISLDIEPIQIQQLGVRLEYIFDNSIEVSINVRNGLRAKIYTEAIKRLSLQLFDPFSLDFNRGFVSVSGFDLRTYQRVLRHSVWANRIAGATSWGPEKILYFTGGTDQWLFPRFNENGPMPTEPILMQVLAPGIRGFDFNIRSGSSYALWNSELRIPIFRYIFNRPMKSQFLNSFQLVGFVDSGSAWFGLNPFNKDNPINTLTIDNESLSITVNYFRDPFVLGYGLGARASLFGYFLRLDYGWGLETRTVLPPRLHISFGLDF